LVAGRTNGLSFANPLSKAETSRAGEVKRHKWLGGMLSFYYREAA
jgi:hypothetical protein